MINKYVGKGKSTHFKGSNILQEIYIYMFNSKVQLYGQNIKAKGEFSMFHLEWRKILLTNLDNLQMGDFLEIIVQL